MKHQDLNNQDLKNQDLKHEEQITITEYDIQPILDFVNKENICVNADNQTFGCTEDCTGTERCAECQKEFRRRLQIAINENLINNIEELKKRKEQGWRCQ